MLAPGSVRLCHHDHKGKVSISTAVSHCRGGLLIPGQSILQSRSRYQNPAARLNGSHCVVDDDRWGGMVVSRYSPTAPDLPNEMETGPGKQIQIEDPEGNPIELFEPVR